MNLEKSQKRDVDIEPTSDENRNETFLTIFNVSPGGPTDLNSLKHYSIAYNDPFSKSRSRLLDHLIDLSLPSPKTFFSKENLFELVNSIDFISQRDYLFERGLKEQCKFLVPQEIKTQGYWENILWPIRQFKANFSCSRAF